MVRLPPSYLIFHDSKKKKSILFSYLGFEKKKEAVSGDLGVEKKPKGEFYALVKSSENCVPVLVYILLRKNLK